MEKRNWVMVLAALLILSASASARNIKLEPSLTYPEIISGDSNAFQLTLTNNGDEIAYDVRATLLLPDGFKSNTVYYRTISPGENKTAASAVQALESAYPGTDYAGLLLNYADANRYPFSSIYPVLINHKTPTTSRVIGGIEKVSLESASAQSKVTISNRDSKEHNVTLTIILPDELSAEPSRIQATLAPGEEIQRPLTISTKGALEGSTYVIFGKITYVEDGQIHASATRAEVKITGTKQDNPLPNNLLPIAAVVAILAAIIYYRLRKKPRHTRKRN